MISFEFFIDKWSQLFIALILGVGFFVALYAAAYLHEGKDRKKFFPTFILFALSMLGIVSFDHILMIFISWELTSILSFFLISFDPEDPKARRGALHAALVTGAGGLCLLLAFLMLSHVAGTYSLSEILSRKEAILAHEWAPAMAVLVLLGGMTKSAQFPFSFWLPGAMTAPTPVSSYLHSATMVKAGIFLFFRMHPLFADLDIWSQVLLGAGGLTFLLGSFRSFSEQDLKSVLAYTTVASLGLMSFLIGWGTEASLLAVMSFLVAHALYKCALFMFAGIIDHEVHTRSLLELKGLKAVMPKLQKLGWLLAFVALGVIPSYTFLAKEQLLMGLEQNFWALALMLTGFALMSAAVLRVVLTPFLGILPSDFEKASEPSFWIVLSPWLLALANFLGPLALGRGHELWHGINLELIVSLASLLLAIVVFWKGHGFIRRLSLHRIQGGEIFEKILKTHFSGALSLTRLLQSGSLRFYLLTVLFGAGLLLMYQWPHELAMPLHFESFGLLGIVLPLAAIKIFAIYWMLRSESPLTSVISLGLAGYAVALFFALFGAPDLALTQFSVETLSIFLFVFVLKDIPRFKERSSNFHFSVDVLVSIFAGVLVFGLAWLAVGNRGPSRLRDFFAEASYIEAHGRNVVNVILVDFRGFDTLGEITVLGIAAIGVVALLKINKEKKS